MVLTMMFMMMLMMMMVVNLILSRRWPGHKKSIAANLIFFITLCGINVIIVIFIVVVIENIY